MDSDAFDLTFTDKIVFEAKKVEDNEICFVLSLAFLQHHGPQIFIHPVGIAAQTPVGVPKFEKKLRGFCLSSQIIAQKWPLAAKSMHQRAAAWAGFCLVKKGKETLLVQVYEVFGGQGPIVIHDKTGFACVPFGAFSGLAATVGANWGLLGIGDSH